MATKATGGDSDGQPVQPQSVVRGLLKSQGHAKSSLFKSLPHDLWFEDPPFPDIVGLPEVVFHLVRSLTAEEWTIATKHAHRVKAIIKESRSRSIARDVSEQLLSNATAGPPRDKLYPLLPNLSTLEYSYNTNDDSGIFCLSSLAGPFLRDLDLYEWGGRPPRSAASQGALATFFLRAPVLYPYLQEIKIEGFNHEKWEPAALIPPQIFGQWIHLRSLSVPCQLIAKVLDQLSRLPDLRTLRIPASSSLDIPLGRSVGIEFPEVQELHLRVDNFGDPLPLMRWIHFPHLREIRITTQPSYSTASQVEELISLISRSNFLQTIELFGFPNFKGTPPLVVLGGSAFKPMLSLGSLWRVRIEFNVAMNLDDEMITAMAEAWPHLKVLMLVQWLKPPTRPQTTLAALVPLITHCPHLVSLNLPLHAVVPEQFRRTDLRAYSSDRKWKTFEMRYWDDIPDFRAASKFLMDLLPAVHTALEVRSVHFYPHELQSWENFQCHMKSLGRAYDAQEALVAACES